jgi:hypothetical protein
MPNNNKPKTLEEVLRTIAESLDVIIKTGTTCQVTYKVNITQGGIGHCTYDINGQSLLKKIHN